MVQKLGPKAEEDSVRIHMEITVDLPAEMADQLERLGIPEFEACTFDESKRRMTASVTTTLYRKGA